MNRLRHILSAKCRIMALFLAVSVQMMNLPATEPGHNDSDGDGYIDGPDAWITDREGNLVFCIGEDKNGNGILELEGEDGLRGTEDDETDPNNPTSFPPQPPIAGRDTDKDGIRDDWEPSFRTDPFDPDSDDDGVLDGDEAYVYCTSPSRPDTDMDGLPDGMELGLNISQYTSVANEQYGLNDYNSDWHEKINKTLTYCFGLPNDPLNYERGGSIDQLDYYYQYSFRLAPNEDFFSNPFEPDSDYDGVFDLNELTAGTDPMRGLVNACDLIGTTFGDPPQEMDLRDTPLNHNFPAGKNGQIDMDLMVDDEGLIRWGAVLPISLGSQSTASVVVATSPMLSVFENSEGTLVSSLTVSSDDVEPCLVKANLCLINMWYTTGGAFDVIVKRGTGDTDNTIYQVGRSAYCLETELYQEFLDQQAQ